MSETEPPNPKHDPGSDCTESGRRPSERACSGLHDLCHGTASTAAEKLLFRSLPAGHLIRVLMDEHEEIRIRLDELEQVASVWRRARPEVGVLLLGRVVDAASRLVDAEPHHRREEEVLFPEMMRRGLEGPPAVMGEEHVELRRLKAEVRDLADRMLRTGSRGEGDLMVVSINQLVFDLRNHIFKENNILYPMALGTIRDEAVWAEMLARSDVIGYWCGCRR